MQLEASYKLRDWDFPKVLLTTVADKGQTHFKLRQQMQIDKTQANWENIFVNLTTSMRH